MEHIFDKIPGWFTFPNLYRAVISQLPNNSHIVEVGTFLGRSASFAAVEIINSGKNVKFDVVDTWLGSIEHGESFEYLGLTPNDPNALYNEFLNKISPVRHALNPIRATSIEAAKLYEDNSLEFVFIDAGHEYKDVIEDLEAWYPKVKKGGCMAGHDYFDPLDPEHGHKFPGVREAVNDFFSNNVSVSGTEYCWLKYKE